MDEHVFEMTREFYASKGIKLWRLEDLLQKMNEIKEEEQEK